MRDDAYRLEIIERAMERVQDHLELCGTTIEKILEDATHHDVLRPEVAIEHEDAVVSPEAPQPLLSQPVASLAEGLEHALGTPQPRTLGLPPKPFGERKLQYPLRSGERDEFNEGSVIQLALNRVHPSPYLSQLHTRNITGAKTARLGTESDRCDPWVLRLYGEPWVWLRVNPQSRQYQTGISQSHRMLQELGFRRRVVLYPAVCIHHLGIGWHRPSPMEFASIRG